MATGIIKWFDEARGFGFITHDEGGEDVFCHFSVVEADGCSKSLAEGQKVVFELFDLPEGLVAGDVRRVFDETGKVVVLCGDAVRVRAIPRRPNLKLMAERMRAFGEVKATDYLVRLRVPPHELTLFDDGSAIIKGTGEEEVARRLVGTWLGVRIPD